MTKFGGNCPRARTALPGSTWSPCLKGTSRNRRGGVGFIFMAHSNGGKHAGTPELGFHAGKTGEVGKALGASLLPQSEHGVAPRGNRSLVLEPGGITSRRVARASLFIAVSFAGLCYVLTQLPGIPDPSPHSVDGGWKFALIGTHCLTFVLVPYVMRIFYEGLPAMNLDRGSVFASQLGLAFVMVSIASEMGWHVTQNWYYTNGFTMLNFMFYFFMISGFSLWADSLTRESSKTSEITNAIFALLLFVCSVLYPLGYSADDPSYKIPIYVSLAVTLGVLTYRGYRELKDWRIVFFPVLSVGVNMFFVSMLNTYGQKSVEYNALFHILHDLCGTLAGVAVFAYLVREKIPIRPNETDDV